jgi:anti-sigma factor ChrR (cupin superfamily)
MTWEIITKIEEQAALYALGMLSQTEARAFDRELAEGNDEASASLKVFDRLVADLALAAPEAPPVRRVRDRLLASVAGDAEPKPISDPRKKELSAIASPFLSIRAAEGHWRRMDEGVFIKTLHIDRVKDTVTSLVRLAPGGRLPRHRHRGVEESIVIEGDCRVNGDVLLPGDYRRALEGSIDSEITTEGGTLFLLVSPREIEILES